MKRIFGRVQFLLKAVVLLWIVEYIDQVHFNSQLDYYGLRPGEWSIWQFFTMPLLHSGYPHLLGNTQGLVMFGCLIVSRGWSGLFYATLASIIGAGVVINLIGEASSMHIGASGVVFGWWSFLIMQGVYTKSIRTILVAGVILFFCWGLIYGIFPGQEGISWEGHLGGAIGGIVAARFVQEGKRSKGRYRRPRLLNESKAMISFGLGIAYVIVPVDFVPDVIPVVGFGDDLGFNALTSAYAAWSLLKPQGRKKPRIDTVSNSPRAQTWSTPIGSYSAQPKPIRKETL